MSYILVVSCLHLSWNRTQKIIVFVCNLELEYLFFILTKGKIYIAVRILCGILSTSHNLLKNLVSTVLPILHKETKAQLICPRLQVQSVRQRFKPRWSGSIIRPRSLVLYCLIIGNILRLLFIVGSYLGYSVSRYLLGCGRPLQFHITILAACSFLWWLYQHSILFKLETLTSHIPFRTNRLKDKNLFIFHNFSQSCEWVKTQCWWPSVLQWSVMVIGLLWNPANLVEKLGNCLT